MVDKISKMRRVAMVLCEELGREPTDEELAEEIGIDRGKLAQLKAASLRPASLDAPISDDDNTEFGEIIGDESAQTPFELLSHKNMHNQLDGLLEVLDERERKIIDARFGLNGQKPKTLGGGRPGVRRDPRADPPAAEHRAEEAAPRAAEEGRSGSTPGARARPREAPRGDSPRGLDLVSRLIRLLEGGRLSRVCRLSI